MDMNAQEDEPGKPLPGSQGMHANSTPPMTLYHLSIFSSFSSFFLRPNAIDN